MAKKGKYERVDNKNQSKKKNPNQSNKSKSHQSKNKSNNQKQQQNKQTNIKTQPPKQQQAKQQTQTQPKVKNEAASRNPMNATKFTGAEQMPELTKDDKTLVTNQSKVDGQVSATKNATQINPPSVAEKVVAAQTTTATPPTYRPHEKRQIEKSQTQSKQVNKKPKNNKALKQKQQKVKDEVHIKDAYRQYELSIKQAERDGAIAGLIVLFVMGILFGGYYFLSKAFPQISVDALSDKIIGWTMVGFMRLTTEPIDLEQVPIYGKFLQWLGEQWHNMVF